MGRPQPNVHDLRAGGGDGSAPPFSARSARAAIRQRKPGRRAVLGSVGVHVLVLLGFIAAGFQRQPEIPDLVVYRVELFSPPPMEEGPPEPVPELPEPPRVIEREPEPAPPEVRPMPVPPPPLPPEPDPEPPPEPEPPRGPDPDPTSLVAGENLDIRIDGEEFPFPEYLENIMRQAQRFFGPWTGTRGLSGEVYFIIRRDGSAEGIRMLRSSGDFRFDIQAEGAIEAAGRRRAFGPLPQGFQGDALRVAIQFQP